DRRGLRGCWGASLSTVALLVPATNLPAAVGTGDLAGRRRFRVRPSLGATAQLGPEIGDRKPELDGAHKPLALLLNRQRRQQGVVAPAQPVAAQGQIEL